MDTKPVTVGELIEQRLNLMLWCGPCGHNVVIDYRDVPFPHDLPVPQIRHHIRCRNCGLSGREEPTKLSARAAWHASPDADLPWEWNAQPSPTTHNPMWRSFVE